MKRVEVIDHAVLALTHKKTQELVRAVDAQHDALQDLNKSLQAYLDWLEQELVRMQGEK